MKYKYSLEKGSKKHACPKCSKKRFVRYIDNETNEYAAPEYGRCDREQECAYHHRPNKNATVASHYFTESKPTQEISFIDSSCLDITLKDYNKNSLIIYLKTAYTERLVDEVISKYKEGTSDKFNGSPIFWQVDSTGKVRSGKIMAYDTVTGKRLKSNGKKPYISYYHSEIGKKNYNFSQCMFGAHLINDNELNYGIVESEKTALIMSLEVPNYIWLSVNGINGFKEEMICELKGKNVVAYPDKGCYEKWNEIAQRLNLNGFNIKVSDFLESLNLKNGDDLADVFFKAYKDQT